jgi:hypothetical protein
MGYNLAVYRLDFRLLTGVPGSRNETLYKQVLPVVLDMDVEFEDELEEWLVTPSQALRRIFDGDIPKDAPGEPYAAALIPLYHRLGTQVGQISFSSHEMRLIEDWDKALAQVGFTFPISFSALAGRGAPFPFPVAEPFPTIGYFAPAEVEHAYAAIQGPRHVPFFWRRRPPAPPMHAETYAMLVSWVDAARGRGEGLVGILG